MKEISLELCSFGDSKVASDWEEIYKENKKLSHFSSYEFNRQFVKSFKKNKHRKGMKLLLVRVYDEGGKTLMFLPLCKDKDEYYFMWDYSSVMYCEPVCREDLGAEFFDTVINKLPEVLGNEVIFFTKMKDGAQFTEYLKKRYTHYRKHTCRNVELPESFEKYYMNMPEDGREVVETGRDTMRKLGVSFRTYFYCDRPISAAMYEKLYSIYYSSSSGVVDRIKDRLYDNTNPVSCSLRQGRDTMLAVSCVNDEPVAFVAGFVRDDCFTVLRHGVRSGYSDCEPLSVLLCDIAKYCIEKKNIRRIDFGRGSEEYKTNMGAICHYTHYYEIKL